MTSTGGGTGSLLNSWMPTYDVAACYAVRIAAPPPLVYATLLATDFTRPWVVRALMGARLFPALFRSPQATWRRLVRSSGTPGTSLSDLAQSDFIVLAESPPREIVLGISGRFWTCAAKTVRIPPERFRNELSGGLAQAAWNFEISAAPDGADLTTETRIRCADLVTLRQFRRYWRVVAPGSGLIRRAILNQVRSETLAAVQAGGQQILGS